LNSFVKSQDAKPGTRAKVSVKSHWCVAEMGTVNAEEAQPTSVQDNTNITRWMDTVARRKPRTSQWLL